MTVGGSRLLRKLVREGAGSFVLFAFGGGSELIAHAVGHGLRTPIVAAGFGTGRVLAAPLTKGPVLRVNPAGSTLSLLREEITRTVLITSIVVQLAAITLAASLLSLLPGARARYLLETTTSDVRTAIVVFVLSLAWFSVLVRRPSLRRLGLCYVAVHLVGLPLGGGSLNPARTLAPVLLTGRTSGLWAFGVPPIVAALLIGLLPRRRRGTATAPAQFAS